MYTVYPIDIFLESDENLEKYNKLISTFESKNNDVNNFLKESAIESFKKGITNTFLIVTESNGNSVVLGYFTIMLKSVQIDFSQISKTQQNVY